MSALHELATDELVQRLRAADAEALAAVERAGPELCRAVDALVAGWRAGGRLVYVGAGTSGRIGALDAAECLPTFGIDPERVLALIAGGAEAMVRALEAAEDDEAAGIAAVAALEPGAADVVVGLSASGTTPYTCAALEEAGRAGAIAVAVTCEPRSRLAAAGELLILLDVGPEPIEGSTRMKAGTAQKLVCNTLSTAAFARLGRVWDRHMVAVHTGSAKLERRALGILAAVGECAPDQARRLLAEAEGELPVALVMARAGVGADEARETLEETAGDVPAAAERAGAPHGEGGR